MGDLGQKIRGLAKEIQTVEQILVEECGVPPVGAAGSGELGTQCTYRLRSLWGRAGCSLTRLFDSDDLVAVHAPRPD